MKKISLIIFAAILIFLLVIILNIVTPPKTYDILNKVLIQYGVQLEKGGSSPVVRDFKFPAKGKTFHTIIAQEKETRIEIEIIKPLSEEAAINYSESKYIIITSLYGPQIIPYTGALTTITDCPDDKKPEEIITEVMGKPVRVLLANATERYVLGVWEDDLIKQKAAFAVLYDRENSTHYQIIIFQPSESFDRNVVLDILKSLKKHPKELEN